MGVGGYAVIIAIPEGIVLKNRGKIILHTKNITAKRLEAVGILSSLVIIRLLHLYMGQGNREQQEIKVICDNKGVVNQLTRVRERSMNVGDYNLPDCDVLMQSRKEILALEDRGFRVSISYEKAHQDRTKYAGPLKFRAALNVEADIQA